MSWAGYWKTRARRTADRRKRRYGISPPPPVKVLLERDDREVNVRATLRLIAYVVLRSPGQRLKLLWRHLVDLDTPARRRWIDGLAQDLGARLGPGSRVAVDYFERRNASRDLARVPRFLEILLHRTTPHLVVQPGSEQDVAAVLQLARERGLAVFPRGSGSYGFGGAVPTRNGIVIDLSTMAEVLEVDAGARTVRVRPGARWAEVAARLEPHGLMPVTTPSSRFSTVAGWIATGGLGIDSFGHGHLREAVVGVRVARADGTLEDVAGPSQALDDLFGTEGQLGVLTEVTLRVRPASGFSGPCLFTFADPARAFTFLGRLTGGGPRPSHAVFLDRTRMADENVLFRERTGRNGPIVPERDAVLLHFEDPDGQRRFLASRSEEAGEADRNRAAAHYLWAERFFPLKAQRIGPGLLGAEVVLPLEAANAYILGARRLGRLLGARPAIEAIAARDGEACCCVVIASFPCDPSRSVHHLLRLLLVQLLTRWGVASGGRPYGIGIWNTPFVESRFGRERLAALRRTKQDRDPRGILNPGKFFRIKGRFGGVPALLLRPGAFGVGLGAARFCAPGLGLLARLLEPPRQERWNVPSREEAHGARLLQEAALRCTSCGACIPTCPAYRITGDELVTGRAKLRLAEALMNGVEIRRSEAHRPFQCLRCGLCEEVCQTRLPLRECYLALERWIEQRFGSPADTVRRFVDMLDANRAWIQETFGLDLPEWSPEGADPGLPPAAGAGKGEAA